MTAPVEDGSAPDAKASRAGRRRNLLIVGGATAAVAGGLTAILASGVLTGGDPAISTPTAIPLATASSSVSPILSPALIPTIEAYTGGVAPGEVTVDPSLPDALPLPDGIWEETGPGWVLATYRPSVEPWSPEDTPDLVVEATAQVVYLVSPEGIRYQVLELDPSIPVMIDSWSAGESRAYVRFCPSMQCNSDEDVSTSLLDLDSGEATPFDAPPGADRVEFTLPGQVRVWTSHTGYILPDGHDGTFLERDGQFTEFGDGWSTLGGPSLDREWVYLERWQASGDALSISGRAVGSLITGDMVNIPESADGPCDPSEWREHGTLLVDCPARVEANGGWTYESVWYLFDPSTGELTETSLPDPPSEASPPEEPLVTHEEFISSGVWAGNYYSGGPGDDVWYSTLGIDDHGTAIAVDIVDAEGVSLETAWATEAVGGVVYIRGKHAPVDGSGFWTVVAYDPATGSQVVLLPEPPGGPGVDLSDELYEAELWGVTSWVVAP